MPDSKRIVGWDRVQGLFIGVAFCGLVWAIISYLLPLALSGQGWAAPGSGAWGGLALIVIGAVGLICLAIIRPGRG
jgi:hypothetical protein